MTRKEKRVFCLPTVSKLGRGQFCLIRGNLVVERILYHRRGDGFHLVRGMYVKMGSGNIYPDCFIETSELREHFECIWTVLN